MPQSDEAAAFFHEVYTAVQQIPAGKVTTYGHIAALIGLPQRPRQVGVCLKHLPTDESARFHNGNVPWQRVINAKGIISPRSAPSGAQNQAEVLRGEGVHVSRNAMGEWSVDFKDYGWFPEELEQVEYDEQES
ncbi:hypothetical protein N3K66_004054 [Trichothecium roseum]|uniref:Uncharacterized protein n=1 Tax=Trichothecium roseum TaxID=47278 RepID=A0ACC0V8Z3_9HYPO|nr:hypothetical protein N3K66_004054 [Trichothecium roseum]